MSILNLVKRMLHEFNQTGFASISGKDAINSWLTLGTEPRNEKCIKRLNEDLAV